MQHASAVFSVLTCCFLLASAGCESAGSQQEIVSHLPDPLLVRQREVRTLRPAVRPMRITPPLKKPAPPRLVRGLPTEVDPPGGIQRSWQYIVLHHSATETGGASRFNYTHKFANGWDELGYHFVIGNGSDTMDGYLEVGPRWAKQKHGAHCKTADNAYNDHGIGICLVGNFENSYATHAQMDTLADLVAHLMRTCRIPLSQVKTHGGVTHRTACPGRHFSLGALQDRLSARAAR